MLKSIKSQQHVSENGKNHALKNALFSKLVAFEKRLQGLPIMLFFALKNESRLCCFRFISKGFFKPKISHLKHYILTPYFLPTHLTSFLRPEKLKTKLTVCTGAKRYWHLYLLNTIEMRSLWMGIKYIKSPTTLLKRLMSTKKV